MRQIAPLITLSAALHDGCALAPARSGSGSTDSMERIKRMQQRWALGIRLAPFVRKSSARPHASVGFESTCASAGKTASPRPFYRVNVTRDNYLQQRSCARERGKPPPRPPHGATRAPSTSSSASSITPPHTPTVRNIPFRHVAF